MTKTKEKKAHRRRILLICFGAILLLMLGGGFLLLRQALHLENYRTQILDALQGSLHRRVIYKTGDFSYRFTPSFTFTGITVMEKDGTTPFLTADRLTFRLALLPLLEKRLVLGQMVVENPSAVISRDRGGELSISDLLKSTGTDVPLQVRGVRVKRGSLRFVDQGIGPGPVVTSLQEMNLTMSHLVRGRKSDLKLTGSLLQGNTRGELRIDGTVTPSPKGRPFTESGFSGSIEAGDLDAGHFWNYYRGRVPFRKVAAHVSLDMTFRGKLSAFSSKGKIRLNGLRFDYPEVFHAVLTPKEVSLSYALELTPKDLEASSLNLKVDGFNIKGSCSLKDWGSRDPFLSARASTAPFRLEGLRSYVPYGIIAKDTSEYIEQHVMGGTYRLEQGSLVGRISQIAHMELGTNYNVLHIKGTVDKGLVSYGPSVPAFNEIKGNLEMRGKDFILSGMQARFGSSPFSLEGRITDYPLSTPCGYPFTMIMKPRPAEAAWLLNQEKTRRMAFSGDSTIFLQGSGPTSGYALSGRWDLSPAAYSYRDLIAKPAGQPNLLSFQSVITREGANVPAFRFDMAPLSLNGSAAYRSGAKSAMTFSVKTNEFPLQALAPRFPRITRFHPSGRVLLSVKGSGGEDWMEGVELGGEVSLKGVSFKPRENGKPLTQVTGVVGFQGESLKTQMLSVRLGNSTVSGSGTLTGFTSPSFNLVFSSPSLDPSDLGLRVPGKPVRLQRVQGNVALRDDVLSLKSLSMQINRTILNVSGTVDDLNHPRARLLLQAAYLDMDDVALLASLEQEKGAKGGPSPLAVFATVQAEAGRFHNVDFRKLRTNIHFEQKILYLEETECGVLGGTFSGKGRVDFGTSGGPRYQTTFSLRKASAAQFLQSLETGRELTGTLSLEGELTAKGDTLKEVKASTLGNIRLQCENGTLKKFALLSKLFSILNVSQLFKFRLPDMVSGGMPYNQISASFSFRDGVVSTSDLFIDSNAMNISMVGTFDLVKEQVNVTIGVKPLQTIDKVVSRIPVVGWVLTGKNKSLITAYFEATGSLDNPTVRSITVKSMAKGVFSIFTRLFQLPAKLVTDTGEVIINQ